MNFIKKKKAVVTELESGTIFFMVELYGCQYKLDVSKEIGRIENTECCDWLREAFQQVVDSGEFKQQVMTKAVELAKADLQAEVKETIEALSEN